MAFPNNISPKMHPTLHMSTAFEYFYDPNRISGALYHLVATYSVKIGDANFFVLNFFYYYYHLQLNMKLYEPTQNLLASNYMMHLLINLLVSSHDESNHPNVSTSMISILDKLYISYVWFQVYSLVSPKKKVECLFIYYFM